MFGFLKRVFGKRMPDPVALILLQTEPRVLTRGHVAHAVGTALDRPFPEDQVTEEQFCYHRLRVDGYELTVASAPTPYIPKDRATGKDLRLDDVIRRHEAAILVDCWVAPAGKAREEATGTMGRIVAALADESSLGVYCFHTQRLNVWDEKLRTLFQNGEAMEAMQSVTFDPIVNVATEDEAMNAAMEEARRRWPEFVTAFAEREDDDAFIVKARFGDDDRAEHMWLTAQDATTEAVVGILESDPFGLPRPRKGDRVRVELADVSDWIYVSKGQEGGNFTSQLVQAAQNR